MGLFIGRRRRVRGLMPSRICGLDWPVVPGSSEHYTGGGRTGQQSSTGRAKWVRWFNSLGATQVTALP